MKNRFTILNLIGRLLKIIGTAELLLAVVSPILFPLALSNSDALLMQFGLKSTVEPGSGMVSGIIAGAIVFLVGLACGLFTFAAGELFNLLIALYENSQSILHHLENPKNSNRS